MFDEDKLKLFAVNQTPDEDEDEDKDKDEDLGAVFQVGTGPSVISKNPQTVGGTPGVAAVAAAMKGNPAAGATNVPVANIPGVTPTDTNSVVPDDTKPAYAKVLEFITNTFYKTPDNSEVNVIISNEAKSDNYYDQKDIVLASGLIDAFGALNLPRFTVYYHELGHHLYSNGMFTLVENWQKLTNAGPVTFEERYMHLINWIEDFFIEGQLIKDHPYLTDVLTCIKKMPPDYDITRIEYAFNYWYINQAPTPALNYVDQIAFKAYITRLMAFRSSNATRFGKGIINMLSIKHTTETQFILLIIEFYNWCVAHKIFPKNATLPSLQNPNDHLQGPGQGGNQPGQGDPDGDSKPGDQGQGGNGGTYSEHSHQVGKKDPNAYHEVQHIATPTDMFKDDLVAENRMIDKQYLDMSQRVQAENATLDGLFSTKYHDSPIIQPKVIVPNFFNPNRLVDQVLFREKEHTYMNVAIYRDISGSTSGDCHRLMGKICDQLFKDIPVDITYYLYSSGPVSIIDVPYVPWENTDSPPSIYVKNPLFKQLDGGTNSDAIADVITQQLSDKWLNIIITDGDLNRLMARDNIMALLKNVFVVSVNSDVPSGLLGVRVDDVGGISKITPLLSTINISKT